MPILRKHQRTTYTIIDNDALRDTELSWRATGMLCYLLSLPENWSVNIEDLTRRKSDGRTATRSTLQELKDAGYVKLEETRDVRGQFHRILHVHETCQAIDQNQPDSLWFTDDGQPDFGEPDTKKETVGITKKKRERARTEKQQQHDQRIEALIEAMGWDKTSMTPGAVRSVAVAAAQLKDLAPTREEVLARARVYQRTQPGKLTPHALVKWWADCAPDTGCPNGCGPDGYYYPNDSDPYPVACQHPPCGEKRKVRS